ncbi:MDR family MFS transporter [Streptomyces sp. CB01881]|uniref:MDR family MFS transporter n=1 Tax=Streptomyces sp. CB01881 TaxID=2078691 RepID=UPI000CDC4373|nr:MDR family MFS transporter [Streptomyces sp. CB01881]AUY53400.1 MFS transporter [Streptomyces sp. CB01881]TYC69553.1 DHA2 family efflux MFS transporter permease subunit [Streptomyces sp. CB01881]
MGAVLALGPVLALLDTTIVNVGIDSVARDLHSSMAAVQWVSTGYLLAISLTMPLSGWAAGRFGARRTWLVSVALFVAGSALCGLAWSTGSLIAFRVLQGIGGGLIQPLGQTIMVQAAGPSRIGRVMGTLMLPISLAPVLGPVLGGLVLEHLAWRWMFLLNVPVGLATLLLAARLVPSDGHRAEPRPRLDVTGLALLSPGLTALVYGLATIGGAAGAGSGAAVTLGCALLLGYSVHALRTPVEGRPPLIDLRLFARRGFSVATANSFLQGAALYSSMFLVPLYYQQVEQRGAVEAGLLLAPQALGTAVTSLLAARIADRMAPRPLILIGIACSLLSTLAFTRLGAGTGPADGLLAASLALRGAGMGIIVIPGMAAVYGSVGRAQVPAAAGAVNVLNRVGGALGTAVLTLVLQRSLAGHPGYPAAAFGSTFWWVLGLSALAIAPALLYPAGRKRP